MIPLWTLLIPLGVFLLILAVFAFFNFYHVLRFGFGDPVLSVGTFLYIGVTVIILFYSANSLSGLDLHSILINFSGSVQPF